VFLTAGVGLAAIASSCTALTSLDLTDCLQLRDEDLRSFAWGSSEGVLRRYPDPKRDAELLLRKLWGDGAVAATKPTTPQAGNSNSNSNSSSNSGSGVPGVQLTVSTSSPVASARGGASPTPMGLKAAMGTSGSLQPAAAGSPLKPGAPGFSATASAVLAAPATGGGLTSRSFAFSEASSDVGQDPQAPTGVNTMAEMLDNDLPPYVASLKRLVLDGCFSIGDRGIISMVKRCRALSELSISVRACYYMPTPTKRERVGCLIV
jgi:hypothetical protein